MIINPSGFREFPDIRTLTTHLIPIQNTEYLLKAYITTQTLEDLVTQEVYVTFPSPTIVTPQGLYDGDIYSIEVTRDAGGDSASAVKHNIATGTRTSLGSLTVTGSPAEDTWFAGCIPDNTGSVYFVTFTGIVNGLDISKWNGSTLSSLYTSTSYDLWSSPTNCCTCQARSFSSRGYYQALGLYLDSDLLSFVYMNYTNAAMERLVYDINADTISSTNMTTPGEDNVQGLFHHFPDKEVYSFWRNGEFIVKDLTNNITWNIPEFILFTEEEYRIFIELEEGNLWFIYQGSSVNLAGFLLNVDGTVTAFDPIFRDYSEPPEPGGVLRNKNMLLSRYSNFLPLTYQEVI